jgi:osmotically inducible protein OsmC
MSVANELVLAGNPAPTSVDTRADVTFQPGQGITGIQLTVNAVVPGIDQEAFNAAVAAAEKNCPVSRALTGTTITVQASLAE